MKQPDELKSWITLGRIPGVGAKNFQTLLYAFDSPKVALQANEEQLKQAGISPNLAASIVHTNKLNDANNDLEWLNASEQHHIITLQCKEYPQLLKNISNPPPLLYIHGSTECLNDPQIAIIGSRNPTPGGASSAYEFAKYLSNTGFAITSGLALGIDGQAHKGALEGGGPTIAVTATGIDRVYPARHRKLAHQIVEQGAIVSEFPVGTQPKAENFPRRNRIISGMSHGTLVVEAALRSGSLITARYASEQNREVFAIPGSIHNPLAKGCHRLIRDGAKLVETAQDIMEEMASVIDIQSITPHEKPADNSHEHDAHKSTLTNTGNDTTEYQQLLDKMGFDPITIDALVISTGQTPESLSAMLLILELQNQVAANGGGTYTRLK